MNDFSIEALLRLVSALPLPLSHALGAGIGRLAGWVPNRYGAYAAANLGICFKDLDAAARERLLRRSLREQGRTLMELPALLLRSPEWVLGLIVEERGGELMTREPERPLIVLSPHLGAWELAGLHLAATAGRPTAILYRPQRRLDALLVSARARSGAIMASDDATGVRRIFRVLKRGGVAGILPDQLPRQESGQVTAPFFGEPVATMNLISGLARRTGARVIFKFAERLRRGYRIHYLEAPEGIDDADPVRAAEALNAGVEALVRRCPEQYLWTYKRFRRRPNGLPSPYP